MNTKTKSTLHLNPAKCYKEHLGFIVFQNELSAAHWIYHYKKHTTINERKCKKKEKGLHQTGGHTFKEAFE